MGALQSPAFNSPQATINRVWWWVLTVEQRQTIMDFAACTQASAKMMLAETANRALAKRWKPATPKRSCPAKACRRRCRPGSRTVSVT